MGKTSLLGMYTSKGQKFPKSYNAVGMLIQYLPVLVLLKVLKLLAHVFKCKHALILFLLIEQTMGVEAIVAQVPIPDTTLIAELYMLDTSGSDLYKESLPQYWSGVYFAMIVFDITNAESFESCKQWNDELKKNRWVG